MISTTQKINAKLMWFIIILVSGAVFGLGTCWANETPVIFVVSSIHLTPHYAPFFVAKELGYWEPSNSWLAERFTVGSQMRYNL
jgi:hypothetical protein